ncbi:MAG: inosine monophosphate cyclohydrolase [Ruminococcaceae bacterium]|nr:inosine monophosphate cyclohydrolase [Oscillospiraceae bacterium]
MALYDLKKLLSENTYPGRGIVVGKSADGKKAMIAYFIMGRSENSRNRVFERFEGGMRTKAFDESKLSDPSLIIYNPYLQSGGVDIVTNGDQTNTIYDFVKDSDDGFAFEKALRTREFEPDAPNFTPRISSALYYCFPRNTFSYKMSILKSANGRPEACNRFTYDYAVPENGIGHFIHTYRCDGNPIPSFYGEPEEVSLPNTAKELADLVWENLNEDNKVSLFVRVVPLDGSEAEEIIINKNK